MNYTWRCKSLHVEVTTHIEKSLAHSDVWHKYSESINGSWVDQDRTAPCPEHQVPIKLWTWSYQVPCKGIFQPRDDNAYQYWMTNIQMIIYQEMGSSETQRDSVCRWRRDTAQQSHSWKAQTVCDPIKKKSPRERQSCYSTQNRPIWKLQQWQQNLGTSGAKMRQHRKRVEPRNSLKCLKNSKDHQQVTWATQIGFKEEEKT